MDHIYTIKKHPRLRKKFAIFRFGTKEILEDRQGRGIANFEIALKIAKQKFHAGLPSGEQPRTN